MIPYTPALLVAAAGALIGLSEDARADAGAMVGLTENSRADAGGRLLDMLLAPFHQLDAEPFDPAMQWDAAFVNHVGVLSHLDIIPRTTCWPIPPCRDARRLGEYAAKHDAFVETPEDGDLALVHGPARQGFVRAAVVERVIHEFDVGHGAMVYECLTIEGDTDEAQRMGGGRILRHRRRLSTARNDAFVRWTSIERRATALIPIHAPAIALIPTDRPAHLRLERAQRQDTAARDIAALDIAA